MSLIAAKEVESDNAMSVFLYALRAPETRRQYPRRLKMFFDSLKLKGTSMEEQARDFLVKGKESPQWAELSLIRFMAFQKEKATRGEISYSTIGNYYKATKLFCEMNDLTLGWKKISLGIPTGRKAANDRAPTIEELKKLSEYPDRRIKAIVYIMSSSGIRLGAWDQLQWKHVTPITNDKDEIIVAKLLICPSDPEAYYTFITPTAYFALKEWIDYRTAHGERITEESWLMRDLWQTTDMNHGAKFGVLTYPKQLTSKGIKSLLERAIRAQRLCKPLPVGINRREWKGAHGFRKYFHTNTEQVMLPIHVEMLMGHDTGISMSYYRPTEKNSIGGLSEGCRPTND
ncbi:MAG TPA: hypothetical protein VFI73_02950 [Candidatus Nitrosopolaris sp.]|nr:hypothetical protein [Candidatus Nitrosopolaris sp.]